MKFPFTGKSFLEAMIALKDKSSGTVVGSITIDGEPVEFQDGETIYQITERCRSEVPTLCYDDRLEARGLSSYWPHFSATRSGAGIIMSNAFKSRFVSVDGFEVILGRMLAV